MLKVNDNITIPSEFITFSAARSSGPGGQNVNKVNSQVIMRFDLNRCPALNDHVKIRLRNLARPYLLADGNILINSQQDRSQHQNKRICLEKLQELILKALVRPKTRKPTKPSKAAIQKRIDSKKQRSKLKQMRHNTIDNS